MGITRARQALTITWNTGRGNATEATPLLALRSFWEAEQRERTRNMPLGADFAFTQGSLQDYADCARRFELRYIMRLRYPALEVNQWLEYEERIRQGNRFHKLVQQHLLGVPADLLAASLADDADLAQWWDNYLERGLAGLPPERHAEITLQATLGGQRLVAKYDLLALEAGGAAVIVDWKTGERIPSQHHLRGRMQTVVYRYVLAQAGAHLYGEPIPPERIRMDYVYVAQGGQRRQLRLFNARRWRRTKRGCWK